MRPTTPPALAAVNRRACRRPSRLPCPPGPGRRNRPEPAIRPTQQHWGHMPQSSARARRGSSARFLAPGLTLPAAPVRAPRAAANRGGGCVAVPVARRAETRQGILIGYPLKRSAVTRRDFGWLGSALRGSLAEAGHSSPAARRAQAAVLVHARAAVSARQQSPPGLQYPPGCSLRQGCSIRHRDSAVSARAAVSAIVIQQSPPGLQYPPS